MGSHRLSEAARGVYVIAATPFFDGGALDLDSAGRLVEFYIDKGVSGITILGMMGEAPKLAPDEATRLMSCVLEQVDGRVPVIVGVSSAGTDNLVRLAHASMERGAAGVMVAPLPWLGTDDKVYRYITQVCAALGPDVPVCYQDYPQSTRSETSVPLLNRLIAELGQVVVLKHEDCPGLNKISQLRAAAGQGLRRIAVLVGNGGLYLPQELQRGADGAMTGFAFPEMLVEVVRLHAAGEVDRAEDLFDAYLPLVRYEQQPGLGLALRKEVLHRRGAIASPAVRAPGPTLTADDRAELTRLIDRVQRKLDQR